MTDEKKPLPTKKWLMDQMAFHGRQMLLNQGSLNLLEAMLKSGVFVDEKEEVKTETPLKVV